jgi:hypothetical protein
MPGAVNLPLLGPFFTSDALGKPLASAFAFCGNRV